MPALSTPGAGGAYRYDPETDSYVLLEATADDLAPAHPLAEPIPAPPVLSPALSGVEGGAEGPAPAKAKASEKVASGQ